MTDWAQLKHAYGSAEDIPGLLAQAEADQNAPVWEDLWLRLCHQGSVYPASFAALPELARIARQWSPSERTAPLYLASSIVGNSDGAAMPGHEAEIAELAGLTEEALGEPGLTGKPGTYVSLLGALLDLQGIEGWGEQLDGLRLGEYEVECPECAETNIIVIGDGDGFTTLDETYLRNPDAERFPVLPADPAAMTELGGQLHQRAVADGQPDIAIRLTYLFGSARCGACAEAFGVDDAIAADWADY